MLLPSMCISGLGHCAGGPAVSALFISQFGELCACFPTDFQVSDRAAVESVLFHNRIGGQGLGTAQTALYLGHFLV